MCLFKTVLSLGGTNEKASSHTKETDSCFLAHLLPPYDIESRNGMDRFLSGNDTALVSTRNWTSDPAPAPWITFTIGGVLAFVQIIMWRIRYIRLKNNADQGEGHNCAYALSTRAMLSAYIDADEHWYTITKMGAQSFLFLGGIQLNYHVTFSIM